MSVAAIAYIYALYVSDGPIPVAARSRRGSEAARLLGLRFRVPPGACICVSCECCMLSCRHLCVGLITRLEKSYRV